MNFFSGYQLMINGRLVEAPSSFDAYNPATEDVIAAVPDASREQLDQAVEAAREAFKTWSVRPLSERQALVARIGDAIEAHAEDFKRLLTLEQGKARTGAEWEIGGSIIWCREIAKQEIPVDIVEASDDRKVETHRVPLGVIGAICPWNFPVLLAIRKIAPALVAGNTMVLKPSPYTSLCTLKLGEILKDVLPAGVLNVVSGGNDLGAWMTGHPNIAKISFSGSTATGRKIIASAPSNLKRVTLELGGNDPAIVLPDVDPKTVAQELFWAAFQNSAQFCVAAKRLYIHADIYDQVRDELVAFARTIKVGDGSQQGTDLGPIQNRVQFEKVKDLLADAKANGLHAVLGGDVGDQRGFFIPVTIFDNPPEDSRVVREEAFGPVLHLLKFDDVDDVVARSNDTEYGLTASVWGLDTDQARSIADRIDAGTVWINEIHSFSPHVAFGGHKQSGIGVENAIDGLAEYTNTKTIVTRRAPASAVAGRPMLCDDRLDTITYRARRFGARPAIICGTRTLSFVDLDDRVTRLARFLRDHGIQPGETVSVYGPIGWEWVVAYHGAIRSGAVINPVNALLTTDEVGYIVRDCNAQAVLADRQRLDALAGAGCLPEGMLTVAFEDLDALTSFGEGLGAPETADAGALSTICYTSGTTGRPKGAQLSHRAVILNAGLTAMMHGRSATDVIVTSLPLAHVYGNVVMNSSLILGATLVLIPVFNARDAIAAIARHRATMFEGVPTMYFRMLEEPSLADTDFSSLRICTVGGQAMPADKMQAIEERLGCPLIELWGMTEIGGLGTTFPWTGARALGSIGVPLPTVQVRTVDPETQGITGEGEVGELQIRGPIVMQGYLNNEAATRDVLSEKGWLSTGDIARIDEAGHIFILDRMKDVILVSGNNVYPAEIERVISSLKGVVMVGVGRDIHPIKGEVPHAYVVAEADAMLTQDMVIEHCRTLLAPYKLPRAVSFVADLPKTSSGKIMRRSLTKSV